MIRESKQVNMDYVGTHRSQHSKDQSNSWMDGLFQALGERMENLVMNEYRNDYKDYSREYGHLYIYD